jgi:hypothetical protein
MTHDPESGLRFSEKIVRKQEQTAWANCGPPGREIAAALWRRRIVRCASVLPAGSISNARLKG